MPEHMAIRYCWEEPDDRPVVRFPDCGCDGCREFFIRHARTRPEDPERDARLAELREQEQVIAR